MRIMVTGHRPDKLYGYDINNTKYYKLKDKLKQILIENNCTEAISGMALGTDTIFALTAIELKHEGHNIKLHCAIPCQKHDSHWNSYDRKRYAKILEIADKTTLVTDAPYQPHLMQKRNEFMVDNADLIIAVWDGSSGGTANCVKYAKSKNKKIIQIKP